MLPSKALAHPIIASTCISRLPACCLLPGCLLPAPQIAPSPCRLGQRGACKQSVQAKRASHGWPAPHRAAGAALQSHSSGLGRRPPAPPSGNHCLCHTASLLSQSPLPRTEPPTMVPSPGFGIALLAKKPTVLKPAGAATTCTPLHGQRPPAPQAHPSTLHRACCPPHLERVAGDGSREEAGRQDAPQLLIQHIGVLAQVSCNSGVRHSTITLLFHMACTSCLRVRGL